MRNTRSHPAPSFTFASTLAVIMTMALTGCEKRNEVPPPVPTPAAAPPPPVEQKAAYNDFVGTWAGHSAESTTAGPLTVDATRKYQPDGHFTTTLTCELILTKPGAELTPIHFVVNQAGTWGYNGSELLETVTQQNGHGSTMPTS